MTGHFRMAGFLYIFAVTNEKLNSHEKDDVDPGSGTACSGILR
jgi:hypothetical protein